MKKFLCRQGCGACCIAASINTPILGMPYGKKAGERCIHLDSNNLCLLFGKPDRPDFCVGFQAEPEMCGHDQGEALVYIAELERLTSPV